MPPPLTTSLSHIVSHNHRLSHSLSLSESLLLSLSLSCLSRTPSFSLTPSFDSLLRSLSHTYVFSLCLTRYPSHLLLSLNPSLSLIAPLTRCLSQSHSFSLSLMSLSHAYVLSLPHTLSLSLVASLSTPPRPGSLSHSPRSLSHLFSPTVSHTFCLTDTQTLTRSPPHTLPLLPPPLTPPVSYKVTPIVSPTHSFISLHSLSLFVPFSHTHCLSHSSPLSLLVASLTPFLSHCLVLSLTRSLSTAPTFVVSLSSVDLSFIINILTRYISLILSHCLPPPFT